MDRVSLLQHNKMSHHNIYMYGMLIHIILLIMIWVTLDIPLLATANCHGLVVMGNPTTALEASSMSSAYGILLVYAIC